MFNFTEIILNYIQYISSDLVTMDTAGYMWKFNFQRIATYTFSKRFNLLYIYIILIFKYLLSHTLSLYSYFTLFRGTKFINGIRDSVLVVVR